jgi:predicted metal-binding protein
VASRKLSDNQIKAIKELAHTRVVAALTCVNALCPGLDSSGKRRMVNQILTLSDGKDRPILRKQITEAQVVEMVWRHSQCVLNQTGRCPLLVFGKQLAEEINEFFREDE